MVPGTLSSNQDSNPNSSETIDLKINEAFENKQAESTRKEDPAKAPFVDDSINKAVGATIENQKLNPPSHLLTLTTARGYIEKWKKYIEAINIISNVTIKKISNAQIAGPLFSNYHKALKFINETMLINFEKFNINKVPKKSPSSVLHDLIDISEILEIHIGIKDLTKETKDSWDKYDLKQWKDNGHTDSDWAQNRQQKTPWFDKKYIQCVIIVGKDKTGKIETIQV